ncbi:hypothetical protein BG015_008659 [Linnemannia schmuckeri]|uniref:F-box domain-containing protein n=1 Tax=Linnemannia schmuckeri TaxID=64567 RepID=A0A9P5RWM7_9FUNG|nr:hypothetical protein BG015_008659 [Linnemannia schmuckeri]
MDLLSLLPVECLGRILHILDKEDCLSELARLLTMDKYIASVTLPILYNDPYQSAFHQDQQGKNSYGTKPGSYGKLTRTLLSRLSVGIIPKFLVLALIPDATDYSSTTTAQSNPFAPGYVSCFEDKYRTLRDYFKITIVLEIYWCLANPILEQLQSFTILHIRNIERYHKVVGRFKNLERLGFAISETFEDPFDGDDDIFGEIDSIIDDEFDSETESELDRKASKQRRDEVIRDQMRFVKEHVPTYLGWFNWLHFLAYPLSTDLMHVQRIISYGLSESWNDIFCSNQSVLQRCRALKHLEISNTHAGIFK